MKEKKPVVFLTIKEEMTVDTPAVQQDTKAAQVSCKLNTGLVLLPHVYMLSFERVNSNISLCLYMY